MKKVNMILQEALKFTLVFLLFFVWLRYALRKLWLSVLASVLATTLVALIYVLIRTQKRTRIGLKLKEKEDAQNMFLSLACSNDPMTFFVKLAKLKHNNISKHKHHLVIQHPEGVATVLYVDLSFAGMTIPRFMEIYNQIKKEKASKIVICCKTVADRSLFSFLTSFKEKFLILDEFETYQKLYKFYGVFPEITHKQEPTKQLTFKDYVAFSFNKKRTKGYLFSALILIFCSLFVPMTIYYCIIASILVVFALISHFNPRFNRTSEPEIL